MNIDTAQLLNTNPDGSSLRPPPQQVLGIEDFLKLLSVQFSNQDPLEPVTDTAFISQMASFTSLEQMNNLTVTMEQFTEQQLEIASQAYLGKAVTLSIFDESGFPVDGTVSAVTIANQEVFITIGEKSFPVSAVTRVELGS